MSRPARRVKINPHGLLRAPRSLQGSSENDIMQPVKLGRQGVTMKRVWVGWLSLAAAIVTSALALSPARAGTPGGVFHPQSMARHYFSRKYYNAPMPHAIFFYYGFAIHGTNDLARLGGPASHGCVRLHPWHAAALFALVQHNGPRNTRIEIN
jgi:lipoprotein-anchoring transpeptidase ErfK/SrfK